MEISDRYPYEGPRTPREAEYDAVRELERSIFFKDIPSYTDAFRLWPMDLRPETMDNTFAMYYQGQPVSAITRLTRDAYILGHKLRIGFVGGVCTHPDHRGKGLAGTVLDATMQRFADDEVDFVYISGARRLYYNTGANHIGGFSQFFINSDVKKSAGMTKISARKAALEDAGILLSLNEQEQTRLVRDAMDYELVISNGHCSGGACIFNIIELGSKPIGYVAVRGVNHKDGKWSQHVIEYAGNREAILSVLISMAEEQGPNGHLIMETRRGDDFAETLGSLGLKPAPGRHGGTIKVLNFTNTMGKLRKYLASKLGDAFANSMEFVAGNGRYGVFGNGGSLEIDGEVNMLWTLLGAPPDKQVENVRVTGMMRRSLEICFPAPLPNLALNMI